ncbi:MAG: hypothetical protein JRJ13_00015 [Deltaproteobacteria bacterium]|nr:hypothetical protein [Deltaproteobacteria bacterium]MBW2026551.1 hypothetical protein [Deltaproteobacteria bacterium]
MSEEAKIDRQSDVDRELVAMFLRMSPEERVQANDDAFRTIQELRDAYRRQKTNERKPR